MHTTMDVEELTDLFKPDVYILLSKHHERSRIFNKVYFPSITDLLKAILIQSVRLAGLLHDIGHYPFSHVIEEALGIRGLHEIKTVELILRWKELYNILSKLKDKVGQGKYAGITSEHIALILADNMLRDKMLRGMENYKPLLEPSGYELLHKIISSAFDADRPDYLRRDALSTGMVYGLVDINRIIESTHIVRDGEKYIICYDSKALPALENMMDSRIRMYRLIYYHHKNVILSEIVKRLITRIIDYDGSVGRPLALHKKLKNIFIDKYIDTLLNKPHDLMDELIFTIAKKVLNSKAIKDPILKYYAKTLFDRRLLPITLFKREEELFDYMERLCGLGDFNEYKKVPRTLVSKTNVIENLMVEHSKVEIHCNHIKDILSWNNP